MIGPSPVRATRGWAIGVVALASAIAVLISFGRSGSRRADDAIPLHFWAFTSGGETTLHWHPDGSPIDARWKPVLDKGGTLVGLVSQSAPAEHRCGKGGEYVVLGVDELGRTLQDVRWTEHLGLPHVDESLAARTVQDAAFEGLWTTSDGVLTFRLDRDGRATISMPPTGIRVVVPDLLAKAGGAARENLRWGAIGDVLLVWDASRTTEAWARASTYVLDGGVLRGSHGRTLRRVSQY